MNIKIKSFTYIIFVCFFAAFLWFCGLIVFVNSIPKEVTEPNKDTDGIVILTGGSERIGEGIRLLKENKAKRLLVSGVGRGVLLSNILKLSGDESDNIDQIKDKIDLGYEAVNTEGNAIEASRWIKENNFKTIMLVTANYHMPRSLLEFNELAPDVEIIFHPVFPESIKIDQWWKSEGTKNLLISEYNKYLARRIKYLIESR